jgi:cytochrome c2
MTERDCRYRRLGRRVIIVTVCLTAVAPVLAGTFDDSDDPLKPKVIKVKPVGYKPEPVTLQSKAGQKIFNRQNCMDCHSIHNTGGSISPMLDGIGSRRDRKFLEARLTKSAEAEEQFKELVGPQVASRFTHIRLSPLEARQVTDFLLTVPEPAGGFIVVPHMMRSPASEPSSSGDYKPLAATKSSEQGKQSFLKQGCVACHSIGDVGGWLGPRLDGIGGRRSRAFIVAHVTNASAHSKSSGENIGKKSLMPANTLPAKDVEKIADFLLTLPKY